LKNVTATWGEITAGPENFQPSHYKPTEFLKSSIAPMLRDIRPSNDVVHQK
jgi:hypothetical protein